MEIPTKNSTLFVDNQWFMLRLDTKMTARFLHELAQFFNWLSLNWFLAFQFLFWFIFTTSFHLNIFIFAPINSLTSERMDKKTPNSHWTSCLFWINQFLNLLFSPLQKVSSGQNLFNTKIPKSCTRIVFLVYWHVHHWLIDVDLNGLVGSRSNKVRID